MLSIIVSMTMLKAVHIHHPGDHQHQLACSECVQHMVNHSHLTQHGHDIDDCVLCQLLSLAYLIPVVTSLTVLNMVRRRLHHDPCSVLCTGVDECVKSRGPPASGLWA